MENNQNYNELEVLRSQMEDFKAQLNQQKIVNEKLIIRSMKKSMSWIKTYIYFELCLIPVIAIMWLDFKEFAHLSWFNYLFIMALMVVDVIADYRINVSALSDEDYSRNNLLTTISKLTRRWPASAASTHVIGGVVGLVIAFRIFFKMQRTNDEVISQINELNA